MQLIAGYILDSVKAALKSSEPNKVEGLLKYLSHFEVEIDSSLENKKAVNPFVAVIDNIISRGFPTKPNILIEEEITGAFNKAKRECRLGSIDFLPKYTEEEKQEIFEALHIIEPRLKLNLRNYQTENLGSNLERDFLFKYLNSKDANYLIQVLETQREIAGIISPDKAKDFHRQRVDFSIEFPYIKVENKEGKERKYYNGLVIEIDGVHHEERSQQILDNKRDEAINEVEWHIKRIKPGVTDFYEWFKIANFNKIWKRNYKKQIVGNWKKILQITLTPFAVARIQKTIIELIHHGILNLDAKEWNILVYERDVPGARLAFQDLQEMFENLYLLAGVEKKFPKINLDIISTPEFMDSPLHKGANVGTIGTFLFQSKSYDVFLDISVLMRANILKDKMSFEAKTYVEIRSAHYIKTKRKISTTDLIKYREITYKNKNENYFPIPEAEKALTYFLQNIFRKEKFREGQLPILNRALQLKSVIGLLPTGGGKSLTYQLASLLQPGITIVIDPIKSLMQDQYDNLIKNGIDCCNYINSQLDTQERKSAISKLAAGEVMFSFVSPERLQIQEFRESLKMMFENAVYFSYCVIDEVHCVSEWGHDFRTSYLSLGKNVMEYCKVKNLEHIPIFGLTATASFDVLSDVERELSGDGKANLDAEAIVRFENSNRPELQYQVINVEAEFEINEQKIRKIPQSLYEIKSKIAEAKQERLIQLLQEIPFILDELNHKAEELTEDSQEREIENHSKAKYCIKIENFDPENFYDEKNTNAGIIFCPHRKGPQGVTDRFKYERYDKDIFDKNGYLLHRKGSFVLDETGNRIRLSPEKRKGIADRIEKDLPYLEVGFFVGSSMEDSSKEIEKASFENQKKFIDNELNIMVATKAFGMGIDKPNIRFTVHFSIPSSIESFVQEAGRAGRDRKIALNSILFNKQIIYVFDDAFYENIKDKVDRNTFSKLEHLQGRKVLKKDIPILFNNLGIFPIKDLEKYITKIHVDKDNLLYFHNNSFKGIEKEKRIIYELLSEFKIEEELEKIEVGEEIKPEIVIPFSNEMANKNVYLSKLKEEIDSISPKNTFDTKFLKNSLQNSQSFEDFLEKLKKQDVFDIFFPINKDNLERLKEIFYRPRQKEDTDKAIFRLMTIGVIEDYTVDYNKKTYTLKILKKQPGEYKRNLENYIRRYYSAAKAKSEIQKVDNYKGENEMQKCLGYLTEFVYREIAQKRLRAIDDMIFACETFLQKEKEEGKFAASREMKDFIFLYFNSKYARENYEIEGEPYSLLADTERGKYFSFDIVWKYIDAINIDTTGSQKDNAKHLRGACLRLLRSNPANASLLLLKSFSLFVLGYGNNKTLEEETKQSFLEGFSIMKKHFPEISFEKFLNNVQKFRDSVLKNANNENEVASILDVYINELYFRFHSEWLNNFTNKFLKGYDR